MPHNVHTTFQPANHVSHVTREGGHGEGNAAAVKEQLVLNEQPCITVIRFRSTAVMSELSMLVIHYSGIRCKLKFVPSSTLAVIVMTLQ